jgi:uncharacterized protein DUF5076
MADALPIPPEVLSDPESFEIIRVWAANGEQFVTIESGLSGGPMNFGYMIADLIQHGARLHAQKENISVREAIEQIVAGMREELVHQNHEISGSIGHDA